MYTICTNEDCKQKYKVSSSMLGLTGRCKKCNNLFKIEEYKEPPQVIDLDFEDDEEKKKETVDEEQQVRKRRSPKDIMEEHIDRIKEEVNNFLPRLNIAYENNENESGTRLLIDRMLQRILGYKIEDIKTEQKIEGRKADYVLTIRNEDVMVIEAKRIGMALRERQIFQATSYGAYSGVKWALLTNAIIWQLYHISTGDKIENDLIFTIDLRDGLDNDEAQSFYLISKDGMSRKNLLNNVWKKMSALCYDNIVNTILSDEVITRIRSVLAKQTGYGQITNEDIRTTIEENIFQLG